MTLQLALSIGIGLIGVGYLLVQFCVLVLDDAALNREAGQGAGTDAETAEWISGLHEPVVVTPTDSSGLDDLLIDLMVADLRGHVPPTRWGREPELGGEG